MDKFVFECNTRERDYWNPRNPFLDRQSITTVKPDRDATMPNRFIEPKPSEPYQPLFKRLPK